MDINNQSTNTCCGGGTYNNEGDKNCDCKMCQKIGWCPGRCMAGKGHKIVKIVLLVIVLVFIGKMFFGGHGWKNNNDVINTITVAGKGEVVVTPDIATVSFGVTAENLDVAKAQTAATTKMNGIIDLLKKEGVEAKDIKLTNYNIYPRYDYLQAQIYPYTGKQTLAAYVVSQTVEVKIRDISKAGGILSGVGTLGVTDVSGLTFTVDNQDEVKDEARDLAIVDAKDQAKVLAKGLGVRLVKITAFSESGNYPIYYEMNKSMALGMGGADAAIAPQVPMGENKITSNVSITYEIR
jgi:uncharacterized protein YggE